MAKLMVAGVGSAGGLGMDMAAAVVVVDRLRAVLLVAGACTGARSSIDGAAMGCDALRLWSTLARTRNANLLLYAQE